MLAKVAICHATGFLTDPGSVTGTSSHRDRLMQEVGDADGQIIYPPVVGWDTNWQKLAEGIASQTGRGGMVIICGHSYGGFKSLTSFPDACWRAGLNPPDVFTKDAVWKANGPWWFVLNWLSTKLFTKPSDRPVKSPAIVADNYVGRVAGVFQGSDPLLRGHRILCKGTEVALTRIDGTDHGQIDGDWRVYSLWKAFIDISLSKVFDTHSRLTVGGTGVQP